MASLFWVGGTSTWNSTAGTKWATSSGGAGGAAAPTAADDVFFDAGSAAASVTLATGALCRSLDCTGFTGTITHASGVSLSIGTSTPGSGNVALKLVSGMTYTLGSTTASTLNFISTSATQQTIDFGGKATANVTFNGTGSSYQYVSAHTTAQSTTTITHAAGTVDTNGQACTWGMYSNSGAVARTLTLGASAMTVNGLGASWSVAGSNYTINAGTSTMAISPASGANTFAGGGATYNNVTIASTVASSTVSGANTFNNFTMTGGAIKTVFLAFGANQTVTGTLTMNGNSAINRVLVQSDLLATSRTLTAANVSVSYCDFQDITGAGAGSWNLAAITGLSGDCGGCSGITFTTPATQTATGTASLTWSTHPWTSRIPLPQDDVSIPNAFIATRVVTADMLRLGKNISFTCTGSPTLTSSMTNNIYGNLTFATGMTVTNTGGGFILAGRSSQTITSNGVAVNAPLTINAGAGTYALQDNLSNTGANASTTVTQGVLSVGNNTLSIQSMTSAGTQARNIGVGASGVINILATGATTVWNITGSNYTVAMNSSAQINIASASVSQRTLAGGGQTYGILNYTVAGSTGQLVVTGANTFGGINFSDASNARTLTLPSSTTTSVGAFGLNVNGTAGKLMTINASTSGTAATISKSSGIVNLDYVAIKDSTVTGGATFNPGGHSSNVSNNTGWVWPSFTRRQAAGSGHGGTGGTPPQTATFANAVQGGSLLVALYWGNSDTSPATCADNINGAWSALTQQTPVVGSGRRMNWFYKLNSAAASAGAMTVTITPTASGGNSEWMQIAEYSPSSGLDAAVNSYAIHASGVTATQTSGTPTQSGDLMLMGFVSDTESNKTFTANSPLTSVVLDGTSKTAGQANTAAATIAFAEYLGSTTGTMAGSMGIGSSDDGGKWVIGFAPPSYSSLTQSAKANIQSSVTITKTQPAIASVATTVTQTQPAISRIAAAVSKTQGALARTVASVSKTQSAIAKVVNTPSKSQSAISRIALTVVKTQPGVSRIQKNLAITQPANSRISASRIQTQVALARLMGVVVKTQGALARITAAATKTQTATARIGAGVAGAKTQQAKASIKASVFKTQSAVADIARNQTLTQSAVARIYKFGLKTQSSVSRISTSTTKTQSALSRLSHSLQKFQIATARIRQTEFVFVPPIINGPPRGTDRFWRNFRPQLVGVTVLRMPGGVWKNVVTPSQDEIAAAEVAYLGGYEHYVSAEEAAALVAAGYQVGVIQ